MIELMTPKNGACVDTHTEIQSKFIDLIQSQGTEAALAWLLPLKSGRELSFPKPIHLTWRGDTANKYLLEISEDEGFSSPLAVHTEEPFFVMKNLKVGQTYHWRVNGGDTFTFTTRNDRFRFIEAEGALNVRDLGGIHIKQGLLYRGSEINKEYQLTECGKKVMREQLHVKTELDVRKSNAHPDGVSPIGEGVRYCHLPYRPYDECFEEKHRRGIVPIMEFFADEANYPIYFHCLGGADRTGMLALFLRALLGETDDDMFTDYELTSLSSYASGLAEGVASLGFRSRSADYFEEFLSLLAPYSGNTCGEKIEAFLLECNVKKETVEKIRAILKTQ